MTPPAEIMAASESTRRRPGRGMFENAVTALTLLVMAFLPVVEFVGRKVFAWGIPGAIDYLRHGTLLLGFVAAVAATREDRNLKAAAPEEWTPVRWREPLRYFSTFLSIMVCTALAWAGLLLVMAEAPAAPEFLKRGMPSSWISFWEERLLFSDGGMAKVAGTIPVWMAELIIPLGFTGIMFRMIQREGRSPRLLALFCFAPLATLALSAVFHENAGLLLIPGFLLLVTATLSGAPIFVLLGGAACLLFWQDGVTIAAIPAEAYRIVTSEVFPAIPIFTLIGFILSESGASKRLEHLFAAWCGWMPGGIAVAITLLCAFFTTFTGASGATILAMGGLLLPILINRGFPRSFSLGLLTSTGSIGLLLPPSLVIILYAVVAQVPIIEMFKAALLPGFMLILPVVLWSIYVARRAGVQRETFSAAKALTATRQAAGEITLPIVVLSLLFLGWCSPVEAAAFGAVYALLVETFIYRDLNARKIYNLLVNGGIMVGGILIVLGLAMGLTSYLVDAGIPQRAAEWVAENVGSRWVFLLVMNAALIMVGCLIDIFSALIIVVPLLLPMGLIFDVHPAHLGVIFLANLQLGTMTPPVGLNLFMASFRFNRPLLTIARDTLPFLVLNALAVLSITYVPVLSLWPFD